MIDRGEILSEVYRDASQERTPGRKCTSMSRTKLKILITLAVTILIGTVGYLFQRPDPNQLLTRALQQIESGDLKAFDATYAEVKSLGSRSDESSFLSGVRLLRFGRAEAALVRFGSLKPEGNLRRPLLQYTGEALHQANRLTESERLFLQLLKETPSDIEAHRWLGIIYFDLGSYDRAIQHLNALIKLDPSDFRPYRMLGQMYQDFTQQSEAIRAYRSALDRSPSDRVRAEISESLATVQFELNQYPEVLELLEAVPRTPAAEALRGRCLLSLGRTAEAEDALSRAKTLAANDQTGQMAPADKGVLSLEIDLLAARKDDAGLIKVLDVATRQFPFEPSYQYQLAMALKKQNREAEAEVAMNEWKRLDQLTMQLSEKNQLVLSNTDDPVLRDDLAALCEQLGRKELAAMWRNAAASLRSQDSTEQPKSGEPKSP